MLRLPEWRRLFRLPESGSSSGDDIDAELAFHLEMRVAELVDTGMSEPDARAEALRRFGDLGGARAALGCQSRIRRRRVGLISRLQDVWRDVVLATRLLRRRTGVAAMAIVTLAAGIGLTTSMLAVVERLILEPLPYPEADRLGTVLLASDAGTGMQIWPDRAMFSAWRRSSPSLEWVAGHSSEARLLEHGETTELVATRSVTPGLIASLGGRVAIGRDLTPEDAVAGASPVALLSWRAWRRRFGASESALGTAVRLNGALVTIVGVLADGFDLSPLDQGARAELWLPLAESGDGSVAVLVRRRPGVSPQAATIELRNTLRAAGIPVALHGKFRPIVLDSSEPRDGDRARTVWILAAVVGLVLAVACANVAALLLGHSAGRIREFGIRSALGAGRGRVVRQLAIESSLLGILGGALGLLVAAGVLGVVRMVRPDELRALDDARLDGSVLAGALVIGMVAALGSGLAPLWLVARRDGTAALLGRLQRSVDTAFGRSARDALVIGQLAVSVVLMVGAGVAVRGLVREGGRPIGFDETGLVWISFRIPESAAPSAIARIAIAADILRAAGRVPGVAAVALASDSPLEFGVTEAELLIEGRPPARPGERMLLPVRNVGPGYFAAIGMPIVAGRELHPDSAAREVIIDQETARRLWPDGTAIGARIRLGRDPDQPTHTVVGVVPEARAFSGSLADAPFLSFPLEGREAGVLVARLTSRDRVQSLSRSIRAVDSRIQIRAVVGAETVLAERLGGRRFTTAITLAFAGLALLIASIGLYGVVALTVSQRTYELGVRIALGAAPRAIRNMVIRGALLRVGAGILVGLAVLLALIPVLRAFIPESLWDPGVLAVVVVSIAATGVLASWIPARRGSRLDPLVAIRSD